MYDPVPNYMRTKCNDMHNKNGYANPNLDGIQIITSRYAIENYGLQNIMLDMQIGQTNMHISKNGIQNSSNLIVVV